MKKILLPLIVFILVMPIASFAKINSLSINEKLAIYTKNAPAPIGTYSQAIRTDNIIYISGQIPIDLKPEN